MNNIIQVVNLADIHTVLVRFHFTNPRAIPLGIVSIDRPAERELIKRRLERQGTENVSDTRGEQVLQNIKAVQVALIRSGLTNNGLRLTDAHVLVQPRSGKTTKHLLTLAHRRFPDTEGYPSIPDESKTALRALSMDSVYLGHVWVNPNGTMIVELMMRQPGGRPECAFVTREGWLSLLKTDHMIAEEQEDVRNASAVITELEGLTV